MDCSRDSCKGFTEVVADNTTIIVDKIAVPIVKDCQPGVEHRPLREATGNQVEGSDHMVACNIEEEGCDGTCEAVDAYPVADNSQHMDYFDDSLIRPNHQASLN